LSSEGRRNPLPRAKWPDLVARALGAMAGRGARGDAADRDWARSILTPAEFELWSGLSAHDRRHAIQVARRVELRLASTAYAGDTLWPAAALMHDVGKGEADLNLMQRAVATVATRMMTVDRARRWLGSRGKTRRRLGLYFLHGEVGAALIRRVGGREPIAAWTEIHQGYGRLEELGWPAVVVEALSQSDVA
jgi:hypothetical protein